MNCNHGLYIDRRRLGARIWFVPFWLDASRKWSSWSFDNSSIGESQSIHKFVTPKARVLGLIVYTPIPESVGNWLHETRGLRIYVFCKLEMRNVAIYWYCHLEGSPSTISPWLRRMLDVKAPYSSAPSCDRFGRHGEWKIYLATKISTKVANWRPTDRPTGKEKNIYINTWSNYHTEKRK